MGDENDLLGAAFAARRADQQVLGEAQARYDAELARMSGQFEAMLDRYCRSLAAAGNRKFRCEVATVVVRRVDRSTGWGPWKRTISEEEVVRTSRESGWVLYESRNIELSSTSHTVYDDTTTTYTWAKGVYVRLDDGAIVEARSPETFRGESMSGGRSVVDSLALDPTLRWIGPASAAELLRHEVEVVAPARVDQFRAESPAVRTPAEEIDEKIRALEGSLDRLANRFIDRMDSLGVALAP
jgi:hypothetical protein